MNVIRTIAPIHTGLAEISGAADRDPQAYREFWADVERRIDSLRALDGVEALQLHRVEQRNDGMQYRTIEVDSLAERRELITVRVAPSALGLDDLTERYGDRIRQIDEMTLRLYSNEIAILEVSMMLGPIPHHLAEARLKRLEDESVALTETIAVRLYDLLIEPMIQAIFDEDRRWRFFVNERELSEGCRDRSLVFWVSRSLLVTPEDRPLMQHWMRHSVDAAGLEDLVEGRAESVVRWLNYGFVDEAREGADALRTGAHAAEYQGLRHAQEIYSSLDHVDHRLRLVLANAVSTGSRVSLEVLNEDLVRLSGRAENIIMGKQELLKYMTRSVSMHFQAIMAAWEYDALIEQPALFKLELCARRLGDLASRRAAKATIVTDIILLGIGITSIGGIALAISDFGRSSAADPRATGYDLGASSFTSWFAAQPIDIVLLVSAAASALLIVLYLYFRREDRG